MKVLVHKASDDDFYKIIELKNLNDLLHLKEGYNGYDLIIEDKSEAEYITDKKDQNVDFCIMIYDSYIE